jgi:cytochrome c oxidase subunit IV
MKAPPRSGYLYNCLALLALLGLTIGAAYLNLGPFNTVVAMAIAAGKASLIALFFMQIRSTKPVIWLCAGAGLFWLGILLVLAMSDYVSRGWR